ncbi:MAG: hybrid sensor histidine kinase/response regulator [Cyanobacteria bacterium P01_G01_bin.19]
MDTEQQIRLNFLDEAEEYLDRMESSLIGFADAEIDTQKVDLVLRAAHSIKGGAAMMGFNILSRVAHRLEDFFKILRVRYASNQIETEVETLLLQSVDCLRNISDLNRQGVEVIESEIEDRTEPIFKRLRFHLGDLEVADENALLAQNEDMNPAILIFEEGVDGVLDRFESKVPDLGIEELAQELAATAQELTGFGHMADLGSFIELCESIQQHAAILSKSDIASFSDLALKTWRRSHALVLRGSLDKLPSHLKGYESLPEKIATIDSINAAEDSFDPLEADALELGSLQSAFDEETESDSFDPLEADALELGSLQSAFGEETESDSFDPLEADVAELGGLQSAFGEETEEDSFDPLEADALEFGSLQSAFGEETEEDSFDPLEADALELGSLQSAFGEETKEDSFDPLEADALELGSLQSAFGTEVESDETILMASEEVASSIVSASPKSKPATEQVEKMVRVPISQLKQFNTLFEQLVLNRNSINLRLQQLQNVVALMAQRMSQMELSNTQLKQWYDRASVEGLLSEKELSSSSAISSLSKKRDNFDNLEMDRYSDIHLICQEQIETIVQLQEVATDIELGVGEIHQSVRDLHYTTKSMQGNVTRTQMLPFADAVKRLPRIIRDLNLQFDKKVKLEIVGEKTLLDRSVIEALADPLMHLLRNSFDHGIEDSQTRIAAGKPESGKITINAANQGTYSVITLRDDGGGIALDKIRDRVCQMGFTFEEAEQIPEAELLNFIFEPGFSTAQKVTELSGRGVGMDVVKTNLQEVRGDVRVETKPGKGTVFTLRIPFSLSILRVAIIEQGGIIFAIPANSIRELIPVELEPSSTDKDIPTVEWNDKDIPFAEVENILRYTRSQNALSLTGKPTIDCPMTLIVGDKQSCAALKITRFWNEQESTIRAIDSPIPLLPGIVSSVVFGDGKVIPLIDPLLLIDNYLNNLSQFDELINAPANNAPTAPTILIVDDSINVRRYLGLTLEKAGYLVEQARDGREAVNRLLSGLKVDAVICDVEMPQLDGYGVLEEIKERPEFVDLPIAMLTSRSNEKHRKLAMNLGASAYFSKPYNEEELLDKLTEMLV